MWKAIHHKSFNIMVYLDAITNLLSMVFLLATVARVYCNSLLLQAMHSTRHFGSSDWCKKFVVEFRGEEGGWICTVIEFVSYIIWNEAWLAHKIEEGAWKLKTPTMWHQLTTACIDILAMFSWPSCIASVMYVTLSFYLCTGLDWGGVSRECFELLSVECFDASKGLFKRFNDSPQALVSPMLHKKLSNPLSSIHACTHS